MKTDKPAVKEWAAKLGFHGIVENFETYEDEPWLAPLLAMEEDERQARSLVRRINDAKIGRFKAMADFDWAYPVH